MIFAGFSSPRRLTIPSNRGGREYIITLSSFVYRPYSNVGMIQRDGLGRVAAAGDIVRVLNVVLFGRLARRGRHRSINRRSQYWSCKYRVFLTVISSIKTPRRRLFIIRYILILYYRVATERGPFPRIAG